MTSDMKTLAIAGAMIIAFGAAVACSDSGGGGTTADTPEEYASAFCDAFGDFVGDFQDIVSESETLSAAADDPANVLDSLDQLVELAAPTFRGLAEGLGDIEPPDGIAEQHEQMVTSFTQGADALEGLEDIQDQPLTEALDQLQTVSGELDRFGQAFDTLAEPPEEFQDAFDNEQSCQDLQEEFDNL